MTRYALLSVWAAAVWLGTPDRVRAQDLPGRDSPRPLGPEFAAAEGGRRGSPVETLESLAGPTAGEGRRADEIETDRDSFTPATTTTPRRRLITEAAYTFIDNRRFKETHSYPELLLRYGLTGRVELRLGFNHEVGGEGVDVLGFGSAGEEEFAGGAVDRVSQLSYGFKVLLTDQNRFVPRSAVIVQAATPTSGQDALTDLTLGWVLGWELPNRWRFDAALRYGLTNELRDRFTVWAPSAVVKVPVGERWAVHAEYFGVFSGGRAREFSRHYFSPGAHYLVTSDLEVGVRVGWGLNEQTPRFFANAGVGWRF